MNNGKSKVSRRMSIGEVPTAGVSPGGDPIVLEIDLFYDEGGANYLTGGYTKRGYYVSVGPVTVGKSFRSSIMFSGVKGLVLESGRFSAAKLAALSTSDEVGAMTGKLVPVVEAKSGLKVSQAQVGSP